MKDWTISALSLVGVLLVSAGIYFIFFDTVQAPGTVRGVQTADQSTWVQYTAPGGEFTIKHPPSFTINPNYLYQNLGPGKTISGVSFTLPAAMTAGTNLSNDSYISVERGPDNCTALSFLDTVSKEERVTENEVEFTVATGGGAGAGNFYEEIVHIYPDCYAIRYLIHSTNINNYPENTVTEFDRAELISLFDNIRRTFVPASKG